MRVTRRLVTLGLFGSLLWPWPAFAQTEVLVTTGTATVWADSTDYSSTASGYTRTHQIDLTGIADGAARQGAKADLGASRAPRYAVRVGIEMNVAPTAGLTVEYYWSASVSGTAGTGNDCGASGSDAAYKAAEEDEWAAQCQLMGILVLTNDASTTVQYATINPMFYPPTRYGQVIVKNESGQAFNATDANEMFVALDPIIDEIQ